MSRDPYVQYTHEFFGRWLPLYDLFAWPIGFVYAAAVRRAARPGASLLDLCTGTGEIARRACRRARSVVGVDLTPGMMARAAAKTPGAAFVLADARHLPFRDGAFDAAVLSFALHDMPRPVRRRVLREAARASRGLLVVADYRFGRGPWWALWRRVIASFETAYLPAFARDGGAEGALAEAGLEVASRRTFGPFPFVVLTVGKPSP